MEIRVHNVDTQFLYRTRCHRTIAYIELYRSSSHPVCSVLHFQCKCGAVRSRRKKVACSRRSNLPLTLLYPFVWYLFQFLNHLIYTHTFWTYTVEVITSRKNLHLFLLYIRNLETAVTKRIEFSEKIRNKERSISLCPWI